RPTAGDRRRLARDERLSEWNLRPHLRGRFQRRARQPLSGIEVLHDPGWTCRAARPGSEWKWGRRAQSVEPAEWFHDLPDKRSPLHGNPIHLLARRRFPAI